MSYTSRVLPTIDIDASWLGYHCGTSRSDFFASVVSVGIVFANTGFQKDSKEQIDDIGPAREVALIKKGSQQLSEIGKDEYISLINELIQNGYGLDVHGKESCGAIGKSKLSLKLTPV